MSADDDTIVRNPGPEPKLDAAAAGKLGAVGDFKIKAFLNGIFLGWWTDVGSPEYWITVTPNEVDGTTWT